MVAFCLLWLIHVFSWFVAGAFFSLLRGSWTTLRLKQSLAMGTVSFGLHQVVMLYLSIAGFR